jgi:hypothetical protein
VCMTVQWSGGEMRVLSPAGLRGMALNLEEDNAMTRKGRKL